MPPERRAELEAAILEGGRTGFQYQFDAWRLSDLMEANQRTGGVLAPWKASTTCSTARPSWVSCAP
uniref:Uncharacterized protein n=1 Tax=Phenylobacterium glaciei TaxID=2803784 RepID=A0A974SAE9_9CAUL|nr:hypothetical protein JKL49_03680 [Phenylobacterium glaciei]